MTLIPLQTTRTSYRLFVILEDDNIERIRHYDPAQVMPDKMGAEWADLKLDAVIIGYATHEEIQDLQSCQNSKALEAALKNLERGFAYRPEKGDYDGNYKKGRA